jgi:hypothetical protein
MLDMSTKPDVYVRFWIERDTEVAMLTASDFRAAMLERDELRVENERLQATPAIDIETLSARLHDIYQKEAHRRGDVRHEDAYESLPEPTKEWDRVLARWIVQHWRPVFDPIDGLPEA